jgi:hypothetical protein
VKYALYENRPEGRKFVGGGIMAPYQLNPEVVVLGTRTFLYSGSDKDGAREYTEVFAYHVPPA